MKFICSVNLGVVPHLHPELGKIADGGNFAAFNSGWDSCELATGELAEILGRQAGLCAWHLQDGKRQKNSTGVIQAGLIIVDIDNQADHKDQGGNKVQKQELTVEQALELDICKKYLTLGYYSPSTKDGWPRFRLVFGLEKPVINASFYQWFCKQIYAQIPGSDVRATTVPNLFYGPKNQDAIFAQPGRFIPIEKIDEAVRAFASLPPDETDSGDPAEYLTKTTIRENGMDLERLVSNTVRSVLDGEEVGDRSSTMAAVFKELLGWANWCSANEVALCVEPLTLAHRAFYNIYGYPHDIDGKFDRILNSIRNPEELQPAVSLASELGELGTWKKIRRISRSVFDTHASFEVKEALAQAKRDVAVNAVLDMSEFDLSSSSEQKTTSKSTTKTKDVNTPSTPTQLVNLQGGTKNREFSENDVADIIVTNQGDQFIYDSYLDQFYHYDEDQDIWYHQDEQHIKRRIVKALDSFVTAGVLSKYNAAMINSVFSILKAKLLKSADGGRRSIWTKSRGYIPFRNGVLDTTTLEFEEGRRKELYLRHKLPYEYDAKAQCPEFMRWITSALDKGQEILIQAFARALLTGYTAGERFLHLVGPGGTGKSTMQQLMVALAGFHGTHTSSLEVIETNKFESYNLIGKKLLLLTDESNYNRRMDVLKKLTSASDTLRAERKYGKEIISFKPECLVCIASNEHITSNDSSSGLERRRLTILMDKVVDPSLRKELISVFDDRIEGAFVPEMSGIVTWALSMPYATMKDVLANPTKHVPSLNRTNIEALLFNNQFVAWLHDCCLYAPNSVTPVGQGARKPNTDEAEKGMYVANAYGALYPSYANFCKACGYKPAAKHRFVERTKEALTNILKLPNVKVVLNDGIPGIKGLRIKAFDLQSDRAAKGPDRLPSPVEFAQDINNTRWETAFQKHDPVKS
jgi:putative DNA primase/helicase